MQDKIKKFLTTINFDIINNGLTNNLKSYLKNRYPVIEVRTYM
jgi:hypothetical protein